MCALLSLSILSSNFNVHAQTKDFRQPKIITDEGAKDLPQSIIDEIIAENPDAGVIHFIDYDSIVPNTSSISNNEITPKYIEPPISSYYSVVKNITTTKTYLNYNKFAKDDFKFSVARGESVTLSTDYSGSLSGSFSGEVLDAANLNVSFTITSTYQKGTTYAGPPEDSIYNSREFRMKLYENTGTYVQKGTIYNYYMSLLLSTEPISKSGTFTEPTKYLSYSIDRTIN